VSSVVRCAALLGVIARALARLPRPVAGIATLLWMAAIFVLSSDRRDFLPPNALGHFVSNAAHGPIFGVLALLAARATGRQRLGVVIALLYAITDEWHQSFVPGRSSSLLDLGTDAAGAVTALWLVAAPVERSLPESAAWLRVAGSLVAIGIAAGVATFFDA